MADITSIMVTRPEPDATALAEKIKGLGCAPLVWPLIEIQTRPAPDNLSVAPQDVYAFTSANGVRAAIAAGLPARASYAVGPATLAACRQAGFQAQAASGDVASLANVIIQAAPVGRILHISGRDLAGDLCASLTAGGLEAHNIPLYVAEACTTMPVDIGTALQENRMDAVTLYSKRSAEIFCRRVADRGLADSLTDTLFLGLSEAVAETLRSHGYTNCHVPEVPTETALLGLLAQIRGGRDDG